MSATSRELAYTAMGVIGVWATCFARYRFAWFPFHPLVFLMWETWPSKFMWYSFLVGWALKRAIVGFGGARGYELCQALLPRGPDPRGRSSWPASSSSSS